MVRAGDGRRRHGRGAAPRLHDRSRTAGPARCWSSSRPTSCARRSPTRWSIEYQKTPRLKSGPDPQSVSEIAEALVAAQRPVIVAGQGVHYGKAWPQLQALAELLEAPVMTTLPGKSAFPENHPLSLGSGGIGIGEAAAGTSCRTPISSSASAAASPAPALRRRCRRARRSRMRRSIRRDINKDVPVELAAVGDAGLTLDALLEEVKDRLQGQAARPARRGDPRDPQLTARSGWSKWMPRLTSEHDAAVALPGDLGLAAHGRRQEHDHHPRRRQPARPAVAVLGQRDPARLYRLGQDDPARLRSRARDGRQARQARTSSASMSGATRRSASPAWISRPRCASACRSCRS